MLPKLQEDIVRRGRQVENRTERVRMGYLVEGDIAQDEGCLEVSTVPDRSAHPYLWIQTQALATDLILEENV